MLLPLHTESLEGEDSGQGRVHLTQNERAGMSGEPFTEGCQLFPIKCLLLGPCCGSVPPTRTQWNLIVSVSSQSFKGNSGAVLGADALFGLNIELNPRA